VAIAQFEEFQTLRAELDDANRKLSERIVVDKAKGLLMKARGLDEEAAYHALRKLAMERGASWPMWRGMWWIWRACYSERGRFIPGMP
jgi:response regulator NasT